jgi:ubiquinone/menaquinone biosynthesis C-methylase UbiE
VGDISTVVGVQIPAREWVHPLYLCSACEFNPSDFNTESYEDEALNIMPSTQKGASAGLGFWSEQQNVDAKFNTETSFWREAYNRPDVLGEIYRGRQAVLLEIVDGLGLSNGASVLDVGCGAGFLSISLADRGFSVDAVDHASAMVKMAKLNVKRANLESRVRVNVADVHNLPFPTSSYDLVAELGVVVWLHDLRKALAEFKRVLKPGGFIVLSVDNSWSAHMRGWIDFPALLRSGLNRTLENFGLLPLQSLKGTPKSYFYSADEFGRRLREAGFEDVRYLGFGFGPFTWFGREVFPSVGVSVHLKFQRYSEERLRVLGKFGSQLVFSARKR